MHTTIEEPVEIQAIQRLAKGEKQYQVAMSLGMEPYNFERWMRAIVRPKYSAKNTPHLIAIAFKKGLIKDI